jgi:hypothetical protein
MEEMLGPSSVFSSSAYDGVLVRLRRQQFGGINYNKKSGTVGEVCFPTFRSQYQNEALHSPHPTILGCATANIHGNCSIGYAFHFVMIWYGVTSTIS